MVFGLFKKKEAPKPMSFPPMNFKPLGEPKNDFGPKSELGPIKELTFPKMSEPKPMLPPRRESKPLELPMVSDSKIPEPHLFVKVAKYQQVRESSKRLAERLKDLTGVLEKLEDLKKDEEQKLDVLRDTLKNMSEAASELDKTFRAAREEYE